MMCTVFGFDPIKVNWFDSKYTDQPWHTQKREFSLLSQGLQPFLPTKFLKIARLVGSWSVKLLRTPLYLPAQKKRNVDLTTFLLTYRHSPLLEKCHFYR